MMRTGDLITPFQLRDNCETISSAMRMRSILGNIGAVVTVIVAVLVLYAVFDIGLFYGPWPWQSPREKDRVVHPAGFSIIKPQGWKERISMRSNAGHREDAIRLNPNSK